MLRNAWMLLGAVELTSFVQAQVAFVSSLPDCAVPCLLDVVPASGCSLHDSACICGNEGPQNSIEKCVTAACSVVDAFATKNATQTMCGVKIRSKPDVLRFLPLGIATFAAVFLRLFSRSRVIGTGGLWLDDWTIIIAAVLLIPYSLYCMFTRYHGIGRDVWTITPSEINKLLHDYYTTEIIYCQLISFTKASFLFFCLRVFPSLWFRRWLYFLILVSFSYGITFSMAYAFQCIPVANAWTRWDGQHSGKCINTRKMAYAQASLNIVIDLVIILSPLPQLASLHLTLKKKAYVLLMFSVGFFITIVSCIRLTQVVLFGDTTNPSYDWYNLGVWSLVEVDVGIICVCMPSMLVILRRVLPNVFGIAVGLSDDTQVAAPAEGNPNLIEPQQGGRARRLRANGSDTIELVTWRSETGAGDSMSK